MLYIFQQTQEIEVTYQSNLIRYKVLDKIVSNVCLLNNTGKISTAPVQG